ncbi:MAG: hypothetical protein HY870_13530 [Chloroflexi bacterium]|nr:hypothetical protein [Chloroflexota bacterium]
MDETVLKFKPDRFRLYALNVLQMTVAVIFIAIPSIAFLGSLFGLKVDLSSVLIGQVTFVVTWSVGLIFSTSRSLDLNTIIISNEYIAGPSAWLEKPTNFPFHALDRQRSCRQTVIRRAFGRRHLTSTDGQKILFFERAFDKDQVEQIYQVLGFAEANGTHHP